MTNGAAEGEFGKKEREGADVTFKILGWGQAERAGRTSECYEWQVE
jgi:hypothetical protein